MSTEILYLARKMMGEMETKLDSYIRGISSQVSAVLVHCEHEEGGDGEGSGHVQHSPADGSNAEGVMIGAWCSVQFLVSKMRGDGDKA